MIGIGSTSRRVTAATIAAAVLSALVAGLAAARPGPGLILGPRCHPLCSQGRGRGPRITAIYVRTTRAHGRPVAVVDAFASGLGSGSVSAQLCYEAHHAWREPGCVIVAVVHGRRAGAGMWWLRFRVRVYERYEISTSNSTALVRSYWFAVFASASRSRVAQGVRQGSFRLG